MNDLANGTMPRRLHWSFLGAFLELSWDPLWAGRLPLATGAGRRNTRDEEEERRNNNNKKAMNKKNKTNKKNNSKRTNQ